MKKIAVVSLLLAAMLAGCASENPEGRTAKEAIAVGDGIAEGVFDDPRFLFAMTIQGPGAVEVYESDDFLGISDAPFAFQLDVTGNGLPEGRSNSWILMYESQSTGEPLMVHVGKESGSKKLSMEDDHGHTHLTGLSLAQSELACQTSPELQQDSSDLAMLMFANPEFLAFQNETPFDTWSYFVFAEGSCFDQEIGHWIGLHPDGGLEAFAILGDTESNLTFVKEQPAPIVLIDQEDIFTAPVDQFVSSPEHAVTFQVQRNGTANINVFWTDTDSVTPDETVHVYLEFPNGEREQLAEFTGIVSGKQSYHALTPGEWSIIYHSTTLQPLSQITVKTIVTM